MDDNLTSEHLFWLDRLRMHRSSRALDHIPVEVRSFLLDQGLAQLNGDALEISAKGIKAMAVRD